MTVIRPHAAHWGAFDTVVEGDRLVSVRPFDPDPAPGRLSSRPGSFCGTTLAS